MSTTLERPPAPRRSVSRPVAASPARLPWIAALGSGLAVLLAAGPVTAVVQGGSWFAHAVAVVGAVVAAGLLAHRLGPVAVAAAQCAAILVVLTATFTGSGLLGLVPTPSAFGEFGALLTGAGQQIDSGIAPVPATPEILFLVTAAFGLLAVCVHLTAVSAGAPAAAGVPLLAVFAVPAALADELLPWWAVAGAAAGFGLLLVAHEGIRRQLPGGSALVAGAVALAVVIGAGAGFVGTAGRFEGNGSGGAAGGSIGLSPFTGLRGQLDQSDPVELFRVRGLERPSYLRALTLREYVADTGWQATQPAPGLPLPGSIRTEPGTPGTVVDIQVENRAFRDYWLPLVGEPLDVAGVAPAQWAYDTASGTAYTERPRQEDGWQQRAFLPSPGVAELRQSDGSAGVAPEYLDTAGVDPRVAEIAQEVVAGRDTTFDRALALQEFFTGPESPFRYSLETAPGAGDDALVEFLTVGQVGYCEQFASAMAVMLRTVGVPARVAVGFTAGTDVGDYRSISTSDAHAWVEAWFPGMGWTTFDPTPLTDGRAVTPPYVLEAPMEAAGEPAAAEDDALVPGQVDGQEPSTAPAAPEEQPVSGAVGPTEAEDVGPPLWPLVALLLLAAVAVVPGGLRAVERRRRLAAVTAGGTDAAGAGWAELLAESTDRGVPSPPSDTVRGAARRMVREHRLDQEAQQALRQVVGAVEASWYGGGGSAPGELDGAVRTVRSGIAAGSALSLRGRLLPRSVLAGSLRRAGRDRARDEDVHAGV
ncbi:transglutaminase TgpA family protein [Pseudonocardia nigra]|uniref:transglutaminase TgpA family protein n=1 Tax=Pseudonocardia nigra TaxID=1921578 RepID=UPI001C5D7C81|nr:transglutaminaseTgpA domain-containing protein [Pseudonocardia nigra]